MEYSATVESSALSTKNSECKAKLLITYKNYHDLQKPSEAVRKMEQEQELAMIRGCMKPQR